MIVSSGRPSDLRIAGRDVDAALAVLADAGLDSPSAAASRRPSGRPPWARRIAGAATRSGGSGGAGQEVAAVGQRVGAIHGNILPGFGEMVGNCCGRRQATIMARNSCAVAAAMRSSRWSWPLRAISISPTGSAALSGSEMAQRSKKLMIAVLRSSAALRAAKTLRVRHLGDGGRDDRGRRHDQRIESRQAAHPWRAPVGRARASCRRNRPPRWRSRARCGRGRSDRYRRRAGSSGRDGWRRPRGGEMPPLALTSPMSSNSGNVSWLTRTPASSSRLTAKANAAATVSSSRSSGSPSATPKRRPASATARAAQISSPAITASAVAQSATLLRDRARRNRACSSAETRRRSARAAGSA